MISSLSNKLQLCWFYINYSLFSKDRCVTLYEETLSLNFVVLITICIELISVSNLNFVKWTRACKCFMLWCSEGCVFGSGICEEKKKKMGGKSECYRSYKLFCFFPFFFFTNTFLSLFSPQIFSQIQDLNTTWKFLCNSIMDVHDTVAWTVILQQLDLFMPQ